MQPKYENAFIYKIVCLDPEVKDLYVGSTTNLTKRKYGHKSCCTCPTNKHYHLYVYQFIRENGGFDNWKFIVVRRYHDIETKEELVRKEGKYARLLHATLNKRCPGRTKQEYYKDNKDTIIQEYKQINKEKLQETRKLYKQKHKEQISEYNKQYHEKNKASIHNRQRLYRELNPPNKERIREYSRQYREQNREEIKQRKREKILCECGCTVSNNCMKRHQKTQKHKELMDAE
jgi:hypothetical protein